MDKYCRKYKRLNSTDSCVLQTFLDRVEEAKQIKEQEDRNHADIELYRHNHRAKFANLFKDVSSTSYETLLKWKYIEWIDTTNRPKHLNYNLFHVTSKGFKYFQTIEYKNRHIELIILPITMTLISLSSLIVTIIVGVLSSK